MSTTQTESKTMSKNLIRCEWVVVTKYFTGTVGVIHGFTSERAARNFAFSMVDGNSSQAVMVEPYQWNYRDGVVGECSCPRHAE